MNKTTYPCPRCKKSIMSILEGGQMAFCPECKLVMWHCSECGKLYAEPPCLECDYLVEEDRCDCFWFVLPSEFWGKLFRLARESGRSPTDYLGIMIEREAQKQNWD